LINRYCPTKPIESEVISSSFSVINKHKTHRPFQMLRLDQRNFWVEVFRTYLVYGRSNSSRGGLLRHRDCWDELAGIWVHKGEAYKDAVAVT
jgi:hypothetical protein